MKKEITIKGKNDIKIFLDVYTPNRKIMGESVVIVVPGLGSLTYEYQFVAFAQFLQKKGWSTIIVNLYHWKNGARQLKDTSLLTYADDINRTVKYAKKKWKNIFGVGHSYGGPSLLFADNSQFKAVSLWDSSVRLDFSNEMKYKKLENVYVGEWGITHTFKPYFVETAKKLEPLADSMSRWQCPVKFITAGKGILVKGNRELYKKVDVLKAYHSVKSATHHFLEEGATDEVIRETWKWFQKYR